MPGASLFRALRQAGADESLPLATTQDVIETAGHNIAALLGTHEAELAAEFDAREAELATLCWMPMAALAALIALAIISPRTAPAPASPVTVQVVLVEAQDAAPVQPVDMLTH